MFWILNRGRHHSRCADSIFSRHRLFRCEPNRVRLYFYLFAVVRFCVGHTKQVPIKRVSGPPFVWTTKSHDSMISLMRATFVFRWRLCRFNMRTSACSFSLSPGRVCSVIHVNVRPLTLLMNWIFKVHAKARYTTTFPFNGTITRSVQDMSRRSKREAGEWEYLFHFLPHHTCTA